MDDANSRESGEPDSGSADLASRPPVDQDLANLCAQLELVQADYVVIGGFAIIHSGYGRFTGDIDLIIDTSAENEAKVFQALESLPDQAIKQLDPGDVEKYTVVRVADEIVIDLMKSACGIDFAEASKDIVIREVKGVKIPFASPRLLWQMKVHTHRAKDESDLVFLREYFKSRGEEPPA